MKEYNKKLIEEIANKVIRNNPNKSEDELECLMQLEYIKNTSQNWLNGDIVLVYPSIKEVKSNKEYDTIHGAHISINSKYINYHALLINLHKGYKYVLQKPLRFELSDDLPKNISDLEELERTTGIDIPIKRVDKTLKLIK